MNKNKFIDEDFMKDIISEGIPKDETFIEQGSEKESTSKIKSRQEKNYSRKKKKIDDEDYITIFLEKIDIKERKTVYIEESTYDKITTIVGIIGGRNATISSFITNILRQHISEYKDVISQLYENKTKNLI